MLQKLSAFWRLLLRLGLKENTLCTHSLVRLLRLPGSPGSGPAGRSFLAVDDVVRELFWYGDWGSKITKFAGAEEQVA